MAFALQSRSAAVSRAPVQAPRVAPVAAPVRARFVISRAVVNEEQVLSDVRSIIAEQLATDLDKITPEAKFVDLGADSLDTVEIMMALEEKFGLQIEEEGAEKIATVQDAASLIAAQIKGK